MPTHSATPQQERHQHAKHVNYEHNRLKATAVNGLRKEAAGHPKRSATARCAPACSTPWLFLSAQ
eukprot:1160431-Pelagomonas_calceolata.AAC.3